MNDGRPWTNDTDVPLSPAIGYGMGHERMRGVANTAPKVTELGPVPKPESTHQY